MNHKLATIIGGLSLLIPAAMGLLITGYPTILHPFPAITVLPAFFLASAHLWMAGTAVPVLIFFLWNPGLSHGETQVPKRSQVLLAGAALLNVIWFVIGWKDGLYYQGSTYTHSVCAINAAWIAILAASSVLPQEKLLCRQSDFPLASVCVAGLVRLPLPRRVAVSRKIFSANLRALCVSVLSFSLPCASAPLWQVSSFSSRR